MRIIFATGNEDKIREIRRILGGISAPVYSLKEIGLTSEAEENGATFEENALIKAQEIWDKLKASGELKYTMVMADDSGLCIDHMGGQPGVQSARFMGHDTGYDIKNQAILDAMKDVPDEERGAAFVCSIAAISERGRVYKTRGEMRGRIAHEIAGNGGFGYDPIFYLPEYGCTSAELTEDQKNEISHRGQAVRAMKELLLFHQYLFEKRP